MSTFQAIVLAFLKSTSHILPIGGILIEKLSLSALDWAEPATVLQAFLNLSCFLGVFSYFIFDWASILSSLLQVILFRRKPMTYDERMPFFLLILTLPTVAGYLLARDQVREIFAIKPQFLALFFLVFGFFLFFVKRFNRRNKNNLSLNSLDSFLMGLLQAIELLPGGGAITGTLAGIQMRNYQTESGSKMAILALTPILGFFAFSSFSELGTETISAAMESAQVSWLTVIASGITCYLASLITVGALLKSAAKQNFGSFVFTRICLGVGFSVYFWFKA